MGAAAWHGRAVEQGLDALRVWVLAALGEPLPALSPAAGPKAVAGYGGAAWALAASADTVHGSGTGSESPDAEVASGADPGTPEPSSEAHSAEEDPAERERLIALVELARGGDKDAFGLLYDHYHGAVYRFLFYRTRSVTVAEDLTSETFFRALRRMGDFKWQGRDFGAWLTTIARNLATDHFKAGRTRLEQTTEDMSLHDDGHHDGPESAVLTSITNEILMDALEKIPAEQQDCLVLRFLQGKSIAETAAALGRSEGAIKQLQLRGVRNLAKLMPEGIRG